MTTGHTWTLRYYTKCSKSDGCTDEVYLLACDALPGCLFYWGSWTDCDNRRDSYSWNGGYGLTEFARPDSLTIRLFRGQTSVTFPLRKFLDYAGIQTPVAEPPSSAAAVETGPIPFVPASSFAGERNGFFFASGDQGLGYYRDLPLETRLANTVQPPPEKKPGCVDQIMSGCAVC